MATENVRILEITSTDGSDLQNSQTAVKAANYSSAIAVKTFIWKDADGNVYHTPALGQVASFKDVYIEDTAGVAKIIHSGDTDTYFKFENDKITIYAGNIAAITIVEDATDLMTFGMDVSMAGKTIMSGSGNNLVFKLGDASAAKKLSITDSSDVEVAAIDSDGGVSVAGTVRTKTSLYARYYHMPPSKFNPGVSGATWVDPDSSGLGGWRLDASSETLQLYSDIHSDWDAASDITVEIYFRLNAAGSIGDTVDLRLQCFYAAEGDSVVKTQTVEVATETNGIDNMIYKAEFIIDYDATDNVVEAGDLIDMILNLETDTSEIDDVVIVGGSIHYHTTHIGVESGDV